MFRRVFVEERALKLERTQSLLNHFSHLPITTIQNIKDQFERKKKPYLHKRDSLDIFIGEKKGSLIKEAPLAYGLSGEPHFYFIHAYNCLYECEYCYLQGYFHSPDLVFFLNYEEIGEEIKAKAKEFFPNPIWFHAGEFSDSLAMSHLTGEIPFYFDLFKEIPNAKLELRTKSINIKELLKVDPLENVITSFSLAPEKISKLVDRKTPGTKLRLKAIRELANLGHPIGIHFDPILEGHNSKEEYETLLELLLEHLQEESLSYISFGTVRFPEKIHREVEKNYPESTVFQQDFIKDPEGMIRYPRPKRLKLLNQLKKKALELGIQGHKIYFCME
jgi:spore photoproduct lyase